MSEFRSGDRVQVTMEPTAIHPEPRTGKVLSHHKSSKMFIIHNHKGQMMGLKSPRWLVLISRKQTAKHAR